MNKLIVINYLGKVNMGSGNKKRGGIDMGDVSYNEKDWEAFRWCIKNNIAIAPKAKSASAWHVTIRIGDGKTNASPETYGKTIIWQKCFEYCKYYYNKHGK